MVSTEQIAVKVRADRRKLEILYDVRVIVVDDMRQADRRGDLVEVAQCRAELRLLQAEIDELTDGRGW